MIEESTIERAKGQLAKYYQKYKGRLLGKNIVYVKQIQSLLDALLKHIKSVKLAASAKGERY